MKQQNITNIEELKKEIADRGIKNVYIARRLGISNQEFYNKLNRKSCFSVQQVAILKRILCLDDVRIMKIFFNNEVAQSGTTQPKNLEKENE